MRAKGFIVGNYRFPTKAKCREAIQELLSGKFGSTLSGHELSFAKSLVSLHPDAGQKIGCGISRIEVVKNPQFQTCNCFWIHRTDGSSTDFSYLSCLSGKSKTPQQKFADACREAVTDQILQYKADYFNGNVYEICEATGEEIHINECHVDHVILFSKLKNDFISKHSIAIHDGLFEESRDNQCTTVFACDKLKTMWAEFHREHAVLRCVSAKFNLTRTSKEQ